MTGVALLWATSLAILLAIGLYVFATAVAELVNCAALRREIEQELQ